MALVSISEAIKLSGVSRGTFYRKYLNEGVVSVTKSTDGKKQIDTAELLRVFGKLSMDAGTGLDNTKSVQPGHSGQHGQPDHSAELEQLRKQLQEVKENQRRLKESEQRLKDEFLDRESWYRQQIEKQDDKIKLLEHHHLEQLSRSHWWQFWK